MAPVTSRSSATPSTSRSRSRSRSRSSTHTPESTSMTGRGRGGGRLSVLPLQRARSGPNPTGSASPAASCLSSVSPAPRVRLSVLGDPARHRRILGSRARRSDVEEEEGGAGGSSGIHVDEEVEQGRDAALLRTPEYALANQTPALSAVITTADASTAQPSPLGSSGACPFRASGVPFLSPSTLSPAPHTPAPSSTPPHPAPNEGGPPTVTPSDQPSNKGRRFSTFKTYSTQIDKSKERSEAQFLILVHEVNPTLKLMASEYVLAVRALVGHLEEGFIPEEIDELWKAMASEERHENDSDEEEPDRPEADGIEVLRRGLKACINAYAVADDHLHSLKELRLPQVNGWQFGQVGFDVDLPLKFFQRHRRNWHPATLIECNVKAVRAAVEGLVGLGYAVHHAKERAQYGSVAARHPKETVHARERRRTEVLDRMGADLVVRSLSRSSTDIDPL